MVDNDFPPKEDGVDTFAFNVKTAGPNGIVCGEVVRAGNGMALFLRCVFPIWLVGESEGATLLLAD